MNPLSSIQFSVASVSDTVSNSVAKALPKNGRVGAWMQRNKRLVTLLGVLGVVVVLFRSSKAGGPSNLFAYHVTTSDERFTASLPPHARPYASIILRVAREEDLSPQLLFAIGDQESRWGQALSTGEPGGTGDGGHGRGIMQIDDRSFAPWLQSNNWRDPYTNVKKGAQVLKGKRTYLKSKVSSGMLETASIAAYNTGEGNVARSVAAGRHPDSTTSGGSYSQSIYRRMRELAA